MRFRFPLEAVLRLRQSIEHQQEVRLRAANQQVARVRHAMEVLDRALLDNQQLVSRSLSSGTTSAELLFSLQSETSLLGQRQHLEHEHARLAKLRDQQTEILQRARRERDMIESLRNQQLREHKRDAARAEQRRLDDLFLLRRNNQHHG